MDRLSIIDCEIRQHIGRELPAEVNSLRWSPRGAQLAVAAADGLRILDAGTHSAIVEVATQRGWKALTEGGNAAEEGEIEIQVLNSVN